MAGQDGRVAFDVGGGARETGEKPSSFLGATGEKANEAPPKAIGAQMEIFVFFMFVLVRAAHPVVIAASKVTLDEKSGKTGFAYDTSSTVIGMTVSMCIFNLIFCWAKGGTEQFMSVFDREPFIIFSINGAIYALGDFLEMNSLGGLPAATYQILQQFRIIVAALLLIPAKNQYQTRLQWTILFILMFGMSTYMCISAGGKQETGGGDVFVGAMFAIAKVLVSCLGAVITDKYMKKYKKDPTHVCIARTFVARAISIVLLSFAPRLVGMFSGGETTDIWSAGFFHGWDTMTIMVTISFIIKSVSTLYIVALLDSILKNIAESFAVLVIYGYNVLAPWVSTTFDASTFMSVMVVVAACAAYIDSKATVDKAAKYDAMEAAGTA